jgi:hypothetical protein
MMLGSDEGRLYDARFIPDEGIEQYFVATDALVLPYTDIFQSGVLFMAYSFGLRVIGTDVGTLTEFAAKTGPGSCVARKTPQTSPMRSGGSSRASCTGMRRLIAWRSAGTRTRTIRGRRWPTSLLPRTHG